MSVINKIKHSLKGAILAHKVSLYYSKAPSSVRAFVRESTTNTFKHEYLLN